MKSWKEWRVLLVFLILCAAAVSSSRILLMPVTLKSHVLSLFYIGESLVQRGHEVFLLLPEDYKLLPQLEASPGIRVERYGEEMRGKLDSIDYDVMTENATQMMLEHDLSMFEMIKVFTPVLESERRRLLENNDVTLERLRALKFDVAVVDQVFFMNFGFLIPHSLGISWITYTDVIQPWIIKVPFLPSFVPAKLTGFSEKMSFVERLINTVTCALLAYMGGPSVPENLAGKYRNYGEFSSMEDLQSRSILFISTSNSALDYPTPSMPNLIQVGGLTVKPTKGKALPNDIEQFIAGGTNGLILVTFGSMVSTLPHKMILKFIDAFQRLSEYAIIWRFDNRDNLPMPDNVMLASWLPQNDILADPRTKLFVTHCGNNGQSEAVYHAVPMIGFPLVADQDYNAVRIQYKGYGMGMNIKKFTAQELVDNTRTIINDKSYKERISLASDILKSERESPADRAAYWIEHVTKFGGDHLRSAGSDLALYEYIMLDVLLVVIIVVMTSLTCFCKLAQLTWRRCCKVKSVRKKKSE